MNIGKFWNILKAVGSCLMVNLLVVLMAVQPVYGFYQADNNTCPLTVVSPISADYARLVEFETLLAKHPEAQKAWDKIIAHVTSSAREIQEKAGTAGNVVNENDARSYAEPYGESVGADFRALHQALGADSPFKFSQIDQLLDLVAQKNEIASGQTEPREKQEKAEQKPAAEQPAPVNPPAASATEDANRRHAADIAAMREKINALEKEIAGARGLKQRVEELKSQKRTAKGDSKKELEASLKDFAAQLKKEENRLSALRKEAAEIERRRFELGEKIDVQSAKTPDEYEAVLKEFSAKQMAVDAVLKVINGDPAFPLAAKYRELNDLQKQVAAKEEKIVPVASADNPDASLIASLQKEVLALKDRIAPLRAEFAPERGLRWRIADLQERIFLADTPEEKAPLEKELEAVRNDIRKLDEEQSKVLDEIDLLGKDRELLLQEKVKAQRSGADNAAIAEIDRRLEDIKDDVELKKATVAVLDKAINGSFEDEFLEKLSALKKLEDDLAAKEQVVAVLSSSTPAQALERVAKMSPLEVKVVAEVHSYSPADVESFIANLRVKIAKQKGEMEREKDELVAKKKAMENSLSELDKSQTTVRASPEVTEKRDRIRCQIMSLEIQIAVINILVKRNLRISEEYATAEVEFLARWREEKKKQDADMASGAILKEKYHDVPDIGHRSGNKGPGREDNKYFDPKEQMKDVALGKGAIDEARARKLLEELDSPKTIEYLTNLFERIVPHSDMAVEPRVILTLDRTPDGGYVVNAGALPGGFFVIDIGLILAAGNESELVGVLCHEMAHVAAGHGRRLQKKSMWAGLGVQAVFIALTIFAPGLFQAGSYLAYYLKQYLIQAIMIGIDLVFEYPLLGVSRDFEKDADQLGVQYASSAGWDPKGFINFFDWMAKNFGNVLHTSFFATHPPFADRYFATMREAAFMDAAFPDRKANYIVDDPEFQRVKKNLRDELDKDRARSRQAKKGPTLKKQSEQPPVCPELDELKKLKKYESSQ